MLNSLVFSFSTTVRAVRDSRLEADQTFSASRRIRSSVSESECPARACLRLIWILWACPELRYCDRCRARAHTGAFHIARSELRALLGQKIASLQASEFQSP